MEIVIATTGAEKAQWMQENLVGHTMTGENLEQRPMVQYTDAADFFDAAMRIYEITAIRLTPSTRYPPLVDVTAEYRRAVFQCEACGKETSRYPAQLFGLDGSVHHFVCSDACARLVQQHLDREIDAFRVELAALAQHAPELLNAPPHILQLYRDPAAPLTVVTFLKVVQRWRIVIRTFRQQFVTTLHERSIRRRITDDKEGMYAME